MFFFFFFYRMFFFLPNLCFHFSFVVAIYGCCSMFRYLWNIKNKLRKKYIKKQKYMKKREKYEKKDKIWGHGNLTFCSHIFCIFSYHLKKVICFVKLFLALSNFSNDSSSISSNHNPLTNV